MLFKDSTVCSLARANEKDIDVAGQSIATANSGRIHTFIATSPIHMKYKLRMEPDAVVERAIAAIKHASRYTNDIEFSCEDASRTEFDFMCRIIEQVINAGAKTINIPDTVGYGEPGEYGNLMGRLIRNIPNADKAIFSVHCHNDLGLAVANSLSAVLQGARQVECTINGLGERAGNASLEEVVMALKTRHDLFPVESRIDSSHIVPTSRLVSSITGFPVQPNKAIVGANAFAHESGIHQDGVLKHRETYEIMSAESVGWSNNKLVLGKHSGRAAVKARFEELGYAFDEQTELNEIFTRFKLLADKKHEIFDEDLHALMTEGGESEIEIKYRLVYLDANSRTGEKPSAQLVISIDGQEKSCEAEGSGLVDAAFKAIEEVANSGCELTLYTVSAVTEGTDSIGGVTVRLEKDGFIVNGQGANTDIIVASAEAYLAALNLMNSGLLKAHPQHQGV